MRSGKMPRPGFYRSPLHKRQLNSGFMLVAAVIIFLFSFATCSRNKVFHDETGLWEDVVKKSPNKTRPHYCLGDAYYNAGLMRESLQEFQTAVTIKPDDAQAHYNRGFFFDRTGQMDKAIADYDRAIILDPS